MLRFYSLLIMVLLLCRNTIETQAEDKTLISTGFGVTKELAIKKALLSAIEQVCGVYNMGKTVVINDELVSDEIEQIRQGGVTSYSILNEAKVSGKEYTVTVEAKVSPEKVLKFVKNKGYDCDFSGETFAVNLALRRLHVSNAAKAMKLLYNTLGGMAHIIYDYKLNIGEPIVYKSDIYLPISVDCIPNDNYATFVEMYNRTYNKVVSSIKSINVSGDTKDKNLILINNYNEYIRELPKIWAFGFELYDNKENYIAPLLNAKKVKMPDNAFWPAKGVQKFNIYGDLESQLSIEGKPGQWESGYYIIYNKEIVFFSHGMRIQKLNNEPLCSLGANESGGNVLRDYVRKVEQEFSVSTTGVSYCNNVYGIRDFDSRMVTWNNGKRKVNCYTWISNPEKIVGKAFCTIHFFICYKESEIAKISNIKVESIMVEAN